MNQGPSNNRPPRWLIWAVLAVLVAGALVLSAMAMLRAQSTDHPGFPVRPSESVVAPTPMNPERDSLSGS